jgi:hypothetical protein
MKMIGAEIGSLIRHRVGITRRRGPHHTGTGLGFVSGLSLMIHSAP